MVSFAYPQGVRNTVNLGDVQLGIFNRCFTQIGNEIKEFKFIAKPNAAGMVNAVFTDGKQMKFRKSHKVLLISQPSQVPSNNNEPIASAKPTPTARKRSHMLVDDDEEMAA